MEKRRMSRSVAIDCQREFTSAGTRATPAMRLSLSERERDAQEIGASVRRQSVQRAPQVETSALSARCPGRRPQG